jgi:hypothetical protein
VNGECICSTTNRKEENTKKKLTNKNIERRKTQTKIKRHKRYQTSKEENEK